MRRARRARSEVAQRHVRRRQPGRGRRAARRLVPDARPHDARRVAAPGAERPSAIELLRGHDPAFRATIDQALRAAQTDCNVLIVGETGTGKELLARVVHEASRRAAGPFVAVNCGAIPRELIGSELFGHEKGAFTGALADRDGYFVEAHGGTLFLDEIGELPLELQPHLLRALETRHVRRVGGTASAPVDVRIVAATNRTRRARHRVVARCASTSITGSRRWCSRCRRCASAWATSSSWSRPSSTSWPPSTAAKHGQRGRLARARRATPWPGNVRELRHAVARAVALGGEELGPGDFFPELRFGAARSASRRRRAPRALPGDDARRDGAGARTHGTIRAAAKHLGMAKSTFADKAKAWGLLPRPRNAKLVKAIDEARKRVETAREEALEPFEAGDPTDVDQPIRRAR